MADATHRLGSTLRMFLTIPFLTTMLFGSLIAQEPITDPDPISEIEVPEGIAVEDGDYIKIAFNETEGKQLRYDQFIKLCQKFTTRVFTVDSASNGVEAKLENPVVLYGTMRIKREDFYAFFQLMMKINGLVCVEQGSDDLMVTMITADKISGTAVNPTVTANAKLIEPEETVFFANQPGIYIATVVKLKHVDAGGISMALSKLFGANANNSVQALTTDQALMINGYGPLVAAAVKFVTYLDVKPEVEHPVFRKVRLEEASAEEMAELLTEIVEDFASFDGARSVPSSSRNRNSGGAQAVVIETRIMANTRDNSLIITASQDNLNRILELIAELDTKVEVPESNFHLYVVQHIPVKDLEDNLKQFLDSAHQEEQNVQNQTNSTTINERQQKIVVEIQENTNSLLVSATRSKWAELKMLLDRLDQPQPQVLIETALIEISEDFSKDIGFEFANSKTPGEGVINSSVTTHTGLTGPDDAGDRSVDIFQNGLTAGILEGQGDGAFSIPFLLRAAQTSGNANVLSKPSVLVSNNKSATIASVDSQPFSTSTLGQVGQQQNVEYQDAGITLNITPSISSSSFLRLMITLEVSSFRASGDPNLPPPITSRTIETEVLVPDGATMWIGGIVRDDMIDSESGIPYLSDIPLIGALFGRQESTTTKTTLFFFCTPQIIGDFQELDALSEKGKAQAAETIGIDRLRIIDPSYARETPADVIMKNGTSGMVDPGLIQGPALVAPAGEVVGSGEPLDVMKLNGSLSEKQSSKPQPETDPASSDDEPNK
jgi:general secretion pathway protein D